MEVGALTLTSEAPDADVAPRMLPPADEPEQRTKSEMDEPSYGSLPPLTSPSAAIPDLPFDIDDSAFDSFGPLSFGQGLATTPATADAPCDDAALVPETPAPPVFEPETPAPPVFDFVAPASITRDILADDPAAAPPDAEAATPLAADMISPGILAPDDPPRPAAVAPAQHTPATAAGDDAIALQFGELSFGTTPATVRAETAAPCHPAPDPSDTPARGDEGASKGDEAAHAAQDAAPALVPDPPLAGRREGQLDAASEAFSELDAAFPPLSFGNAIEPKEARSLSRDGAGCAGGAGSLGDAHLGWQVSPVKQPLMPTPVRCHLRRPGLQWLVRGFWERRCRYSRDRPMCERGGEGAKTEGRQRVGRGGGG